MPHVASNKSPCAKILLAIAVAAALASCKFVETAELEAQAKAAAAAAQSAAAGNPEDWAGRILPHYREAAVPVGTLRAALSQKGLEATGDEYGHREGGEGTPFTYATEVEGTIVAANTKSRAASVGVDIDGDGTADVTLQLGPVIRGTAIRDGLPFISFTDYENQIEFARVAKALNKDAYETALKAVPRDNLIGDKVIALGAVTVRKPDETLLITPVTIDVEGGS